MLVERSAVFNESIRQEPTSRCLCLQGEIGLMAKDSGFFGGLLVRMAVK